MIIERSTRLFSFYLPLDRFAIYVRKYVRMLFRWLMHSTSLILYSIPLLDVTMDKVITMNSRSIRISQQSIYGCSSLSSIQTLSRNCKASPWSYGTTFLLGSIDSTINWRKQPIERTLYRFRRTSKLL